MTTGEERELLDAELAREVEDALGACDVVLLSDEERPLTSLAAQLIGQFRQRRLVLYKRALPQRGNKLVYEKDGTRVELEQLSLLPADSGEVAPPSR